MLSRIFRMSVLLCALTTLGEARNRFDGFYTATAYCESGKTASTEHTRRHGLAADPRILPLGSRVRISNAGPYSGEYDVIDTGGKIRGRKVDIFIPNIREARRFGKRRVRIEVIELSTQTARR